MLFAAKNRVESALALLAVFVLAAVAGREALDLPWNLEISARQVRWTLLGIAVMLASDCLVHERKRCQERMALPLVGVEFTTSRDRWRRARSCSLALTMGMAGCIIARLPGRPVARSMIGARR